LSENDKLVVESTIVSIEVALILGIVASLYVTLDTTLSFGLKIVFVELMVSGLFSLWLAYVYPLRVKLKAQKSKYQQPDLRAHNKRLVEESFAIIEFVPETRVAGEEIVLAEPAGRFTLRRRRPPYLDQLKSHLRSYPEAQKLLDELPRVWSEARAEDSDAFDTMEMAIRDKLKACITMPRLMSVSQTLADGIKTDIMSDCDGPLEMSRGYPSQMTNGKINVRGVDLSDAAACVSDLTNKMDELSRDIELKKKFRSIKKRYESVGRDKAKFADEVRKIVENARLTNYDSLEGVCSGCEKMKATTTGK